jgi:hypothetical protein
VITAGNRLAFLSGLSGVSAAAHLRQIAGIYGTAAVMLVAYSGYGPNPAWVHLFADPQSHDTGGGARRADFESDFRVSPRSKAKKDIVETVLERAGIAGTVDASAVRQALAPFNLDRLAGQTVIEQQTARRKLRDVLDSIKEPTIQGDQSLLLDLKRWNNRMRAAILVILLMMQ